MKPKPKTKMRLQGATLVEVLAALSIASISFVIAAITYLQMSGPGSALAQQRFQSLAKRLIVEASFEEKPKELGFKEGHYWVQRKITKLNWQKGLYLVEVVFSDKKKEEVFKRSKVIHVWKD